MLLTKVILKNYGVYRDENVFDLTCEPDKPIILIGGTNGSGKTTLFESIMLCLYGISGFGKRTSRKSYERFLAQKIHRYLKSSVCADHASIIVQFKFFHNGRETEYYVDRSWKNEEGKILEQLTIKKRNSENESFKPLDTIEESYWQSFIEGLIPRGIAKHFFFDGEKIVEIADYGKEDTAIKSSFNSLLGLDLVNQLRTDLQVYVMRNLKGDQKQLQAEFEKISHDKQEGETKIHDLEEKRIQKDQELEQIHSEIDSLEAKISQIGGNFAQKRDELRTKKDVYRLKHENTLKNIQELCATALPFSLIPKKLEKIKNQLKLDEEILKKQFEKEILNSKFENLSKNIQSELFWNDIALDNNTRKEIVIKLLKFFESKTNSQEKDESLFNFSLVDSAKLYEIIDEANGILIEKLENETQEFYRINEELQKIETALINAPNDDEISPLISELNKLHSKAGSLKTEIDYLDQQITTNKAMMMHLNVRIRDVVGKRYKSDKALKDADLTEKIQNVLDEYTEKLKIKKIQLLENYLLEGIHNLMHKENFINKVLIDKDSFEITLIGPNEIPIQKDLLSKGEQQMFATAVLWALAKTSGKPLPFMIDTPLARLDIEHRGNLVEQFFPHASHQVIIFSTNSEIDSENYQKLYPYVSRSYSMEYEIDEGKTKQHPNYFWNEKGEKLIEN